MPLNITHVITRLIVGGAQENTIDSVLGLQANPHFKLHLISGPTSGPEGSLEPLVSRIPGLLTVTPSLIRSIHPWHDARALLQLTRLFKQQPPHIVHTHSGKAGLLGRIAARQTQVPFIIHSIHGPSFGPFQGALANTCFKNAERFAGRFTDHFVVVANAMRDQYLAAGIGQPHQYTRIFSGFNLTPYLSTTPSPNSKTKYTFSPQHCVVGIIARLFKLKGHDDLLDIAPDLLKQNPNLRFLVVGDGSWRQRLEAKASQLKVREYFHFTGLVPPTTIPNHLEAMDLLVHLSRREGLPRSIPQALAARIPVIAYDCDGASEACLNDHTGFLIQPGDHTLLKQRILQLAANPSLRQQLGRNGRQFVENHFSTRQMVDNLALLYQSLGARPQSPPK